MVLFCNVLERRSPAVEGGNGRHEVVRNLRYTLAVAP